MLGLGVDKKEDKRVSIGDVLSKALGVQDVKSAKIVSDAFTDNSVSPLDDAKNLAYRADIKRGEVGLYTRLMALADFAELEEVLYGFKEEEKVLSRFLRGVGVWHYKHGAAVDGERVKAVLDAAAKLHVEEFEIRKHDSTTNKLIGA